MKHLFSKVWGLFCRLTGPGAWGTIQSIKEFAAKNDSEGDCLLGSSKVGDEIPFLRLPGYAVIYHRSLVSVV